MAASPPFVAYFGISRQCYYVWRRRFDEEEVEGLNDRSSVPHHQPAKTYPEVIEKIPWFRQQYRFGPKRITVALVRRHEVTISPLSVWRILHTLGLNRLPVSQRCKRTQTRRIATRNNAPRTVRSRALKLETTLARQSKSIGAKLVWGILWRGPSSYSLSGGVVGRGGLLPGDETGGHLSAPLRRGRLVVEGSEMR